ncbi:transcriptional regulator opi1 [Marasmius sp. AFHP31]|nr:transcriptional regulator opi1 [Marasmius sp. AFHP31]
MAPNSSYDTFHRGYTDESRVGAGTSSAIAYSSSSSPVQRRSSSAHREDDGSRSSDDTGASRSQTQLATRPRWQAFLAQAGGLGVAFSAESMKRLRLTGSTLDQWAIDRIDSHITFLRDFTLSLQSHNLGPLQEENEGLSPTTPTQASTNHRPSRRHHHTRTPSSSSVSEAHHNKLHEVRKDLVHTVRQVVSVVSKYAGESSLPDKARDHVKGLILMLPRKWAEAVRVGGGPATASGSMPPPSSGGLGGDSVAAAASGRAGSDRRHRLRERGIPSSGASPASSRAASPSASPRVPLRGLVHEGANGGVAMDGGRTMSTSSAMATAQKVLALATESLDMMKNVTSVVKDSLDAADAWVATLRLRAANEGPMDDDRQLPPPDDSRPSSSFGDYRQFQEYRDRDILSPLHSRRGSMSENFPPPPLLPPDSPYSTQSTLAGTGSAPGTPGIPGLQMSYKMDAPSPDVRGSMRKMSLMDGDLKMKREDESGKLMESTEMDVDDDR